MKTRTPAVAEAPARLGGLPLDELAADGEAAAIVARFTRKDGEASEPVRVATFNSRI